MKTKMHIYFIYVRVLVQALHGVGSLFSLCEPQGPRLVDWRSSWLVDCRLVDCRSSCGFLTLLANTTLPPKLPQDSLTTAHCLALVICIFTFQGWWREHAIRGTAHYRSQWKPLSSLQQLLVKRMVSVVLRSRRHIPPGFLPFEIRDFLM